MSASKQLSDYLELNSNSPIKNVQKLSEQKLAPTFKSYLNFHSLLKPACPENNDFYTYKNTDPIISPDSVINQIIPNYSISNFLPQKSNSQSKTPDLNTNNRFLKNLQQRIEILENSAFIQEPKVTQKAENVPKLSEIGPETSRLLRESTDSDLAEISLLSTLNFKKQQILNNTGNFGCSKTACQKTHSEIAKNIIFSEQKQDYYYFNEENNMSECSLHKKCCCTSAKKYPENKSHETIGIQTNIPKEFGIQTSIDFNTHKSHHHKKQYLDAFQQICDVSKSNENIPIEIQTENVDYKSICESSKLQKSYIESISSPVRDSCGNELAQIKEMTFDDRLRELACAEELQQQNIELPGTSQFPGALIRIEEKSEDELLDPSKSKSISNYNNNTSIKEQKNTISIDTDISNKNMLTERLSSDNTARKNKSTNRSQNKNPANIQKSKITTRKSEIKETISVSGENWDKTIEIKGITELVNENPSNPITQRSHPNENMNQEPEKLVSEEPCENNKQNMQNYVQSFRPSPHNPDSGHGSITSLRFMQPPQPLFNHFAVVTSPKNVSNNKGNMLRSSTTETAAFNSSYQTLQTNINSPPQLSSPISKNGGTSAAGSERYSFENKPNQILNVQNLNMHKRQCSAIAEENSMSSKPSAYHTKAGSQISEAFNGTFCAIKENDSLMNTAALKIQRFFRKKNARTESDTGVLRENRKKENEISSINRTRNWTGTHTKNNTEILMEELSKNQNTSLHGYSTSTFQFRLTPMSTLSGISASKNSDSPTKLTYSSGNEENSILKIDP